MKMWENFMSSTEEEQQTYLESIEKYNKGGIRFGQQEPQTFSDTENVVNYSPAERFSFIQGHIREKLIRRRISMYELKRLEDDLTELFLCDPTAVYVSSDIDIFTRLLLHGLSQYYRLSSKSFELGGQKRVQIVNKKANFVMPELTVRRYLQQRTRVS